jgi:hypothetical protein
MQVSGPPEVADGAKTTKISPATRPGMRLCESRKRPPHDDTFVFPSLFLRKDREGVGIRPKFALPKFCLNPLSAVYREIKGYDTVAPKHRSGGMRARRRRSLRRTIAIG